MSREVAKSRSRAPIAMTPEPADNMQLVRPSAPEGDEGERISDEAMRVLAQVVDGEMRINFRVSQRTYRELTDKCRARGRVTIADYLRSLMRADGIHAPAAPPKGPRRKS